jgi:glycosyltransferase involved in cell wall biosynthesis
MKVLVWQWGRFGAGPRLGIEFAAALGTVHGVEPLLSLSDSAEILGAGAAARSELPVRTYKNLLGYATRVASLPRFVPALMRRVAELSPDVALCAMPGPLDLAMHAALRRIGVPYAVVVHDADPHPGDGYPLQLTLQRRLVRRANALVILSAHVERRLQAQGLIGATPVIRSVLPQPAIAGLPPVRAHGGRFRLLSFGRLLAYKGLDLLAAALAELLPGAALEVRVVGSGPEGPELAALRALPGVTVENRWVPESEINTLLAWADGLVLSHREASQSGVAAAALAAGRYLVATRVGGLAEQAGGNPSAVLCDTEAHSLAAAIRTVLTLPPPAPLAGFGVREAQDLAAGLRGVALRARRAGGAELDGRAQGVVF